MAFKVDLELPQDQNSSGQGEGRKSSSIRTAFAGAAAAATFLASCAPPAEAQPVAPPAEIAPVPSDLGPQLTIDSLKLSEGYPSDFAPYVDAFGQMAQKDGLSLQKLGEANWLKASSNGVNVEYALLPMGLVSNLTDPDGQVSNPLPVYYLAYRDQFGQIQSGYVLGKLIEQEVEKDSQRLLGVSYVARMLDEATFRGWQNGTQPEDGSVTLGQIVYAVPLRGEISVEVARSFQQQLNSGELTPEQLMSTYSVGAAVIQPGDEQKIVSVPAPSLQPQENSIWDTLFAGVGVAQAAGLELSATATAPQAVPPSVEEEPTPIVEPAQTPEQALAEFKESAEYKQGLQDYLNAMGLEAENVAISEETKTINGQEYRFLVVNSGDVVSQSLSEEYKKLFSPTALFEYRNGEWIKLSLGNANSRIRIASTGKYDLQSLIKEYYGNYSGGWGHAMSQSHPKEEIFNPSKILSEISLAHKIGPSYQAYHLVWGYQDQLPDWIKELTPELTDEELLDMLKEHVETLVKAGEGQVTTYSVVNEPLGSKLNNPHLFTRLGTSSQEHANWIGQLFLTAEESTKSIGSNSNLILNDTLIEFGGNKADLIFDIVKTMKQNSIPIDGIGFQMHINASDLSGNRLSEKIAIFRQQIRRYKEIGIKVWITEMDVDMHDISGTDRDFRQALIYYEIISAALQEEVEDITFFSGVDENSWLIDDYNRTRAQPTLMNFKGPKLSYYQILKLLIESRQ